LTPYRHALAVDELHGGDGGVHGHLALLARIDGHSLALAHHHDLLRKSVKSGRAGKKNKDEEDSRRRKISKHEERLFTVASNKKKRRLMTQRYGIRTTSTFSSSITSHLTLKRSPP